MIPCTRVTSLLCLQISFHSSIRIINFIKTATRILAISRIQLTVTDKQEPNPIINLSKSNRIIISSRRQRQFVQSDSNALQCTVHYQRLIDWYLIFHMLNCFEINIDMYLHFLSFLATLVAQVVEICPQERHGPFILNNRCCWYSDETRSQCIF